MTLAVCTAQPYIASAMTYVAMRQGNVTANISIMEAVQGGDVQPIPASLTTREKCW